MFFLWIITEWETWCCWSTIIKNNKQKTTNTDYVLLLVENFDINLEILNKLSHLSQSVTLKTVMSELFFCESFSVGHVIITTIIKFCDVVWHSCNMIIMNSLDFYLLNESYIKQVLINCELQQIKYIKLFNFNIYSINSVWYKKKKIK